MENKHEDLNDDEKRTRNFLARATVFLIPLPFLASLITRDIAMVGTSTIIGAAVIWVYKYYFSQR
jgi:hypothetical protein